MKKIDLLLSFLDYWWIIKRVKYLPYWLRIFFWTRLYYYNKRENPDGDFTLGLYINYAKK